MGAVATASANDQMWQDLMNASASFAPAPNVAWDDMSQTSTNGDTMTDQTSDNDTSSDDSYGGYPFLEYDDLTIEQRVVRGATKIGDALAGNVSPEAAEKAIRLAKNALSGAEDVRALRKAVVEAVDSAYRFDDEIQKRAEQEAIRNSTDNPEGDMLAEGRMLHTAMDHITGKQARPERKVSFTRPVKRYTVLSGDRVARPGEMLTGVLVSDTELKVIQSRLDGSKVHIYEGRAIST